MTGKKTNRLLTNIGIALLLLVLAYAFVPEVMNGKVVNQSDISGYMGMAREATQWDSANPSDKTAWTNSMFGGMPTTMITGNTEGDWTQWLYDLMFVGPRPASYLFISLLGAFLMMLALGIGPVVAACGAIAVTFCSYNMQIIQVGHNSKMVALAFAPWVLAGVFHTYRCALEKKKGIGSVILGAVLFAMALNFQIKANHVQITYYLAIMILTYAAVLAAKVFRSDDRKDLIRRFLTASALLLVLGIAGIGANANRLIPTYEYTAHTMRGGSELSRDGSDKKSKGLDLEYATAWSYGWEELPNMMIPDYNGGSSSYSVNPDKSATIDLLRQAGQTNLKSVAKSLPLYWGPQPFTAGPMYMGAITIFLFIMGLGLCRRDERWWILIATVIGIFLGLGNHFMPFTKFWFEHIPFYNKFRTVSMALVILQFTLPILAFLTLDRVLKNEYGWKKVLKWGLISLAVTGGFCLIAYTGAGRTFSGASDSGQPDILVEAFAKDRIALLRKDAITSMVFILLTFITIYISMKEGGKKAVSRTGAAAVICALVLVNMFTIGKRYLNDGHFMEKADFNGQIKERPADTYILSDKDPDFRVLDLSVNVFNDSYPSYFHKNIGGYSPVKLQRYQDLIDNYLAGEINSIYNSLSKARTIEEAEDMLPSLPVLSMLNDRYIIIDSNLPPVRNGGAMGNCWFVDEIIPAETPDEEIALLGSVDLSHSAVVGKVFASNCTSLSSESDNDRIWLTDYAPNALSYDYETASARTAVFSEIYYEDGWKAWVDGKEIELFRADWLLRAAELPAGKHTLTMRFEPGSYRTGSNISRASSSVLLIILLLGAAVAALPALPRKKNKNSQ